MVLDHVIDFCEDLPKAKSPDSQWLLAYTTDQELVRISPQEDIVGTVPTLATSANPLDFTYAAIAPTSSGFPIHYAFLEDMGEGPKNYQTLYFPGEGGQPGQYSSGGSALNFSPDGAYVAISPIGKTRMVQSRAVSIFYAWSHSGLRKIVRMMPQLVPQMVDDLTRFVVSSSPLLCLLI